MTAVGAKLPLLRGTVFSPFGRTIAAVEVCSNQGVIEARVGHASFAVGRKHDGLQHVAALERVIWDRAMLVFREKIEEKRVRDRA